VRLTNLPSGWSSFTTGAQPTSKQALCLQSCAAKIAEAELSPGQTRAYARSRSVKNRTLEEKARRARNQAIAFKATRMNENDKRLDEFG